MNSCVYFVYFVQYFVFVCITILQYINLRLSIQSCILNQCEIVVFKSKLKALVTFS